MIWLVIELCRDIMQIAFVTKFDDDKKWIVKLESEQSPFIFFNNLGVINSQCLGLSSWKSNFEE